MVALDEDALICDFAETYHIYSYKALPPTAAARLACGLRDDSRIKLKQNKSPISLQTALLAAVYDRLAWLQWANTKDAQDGLGKPDPILPILLGTKTDSDKPDAEIFSDPAAFLARREELLARTSKQEGGGPNG